MFRAMTMGGSAKLQVGTSRCDVPARVQRAERTAHLNQFVAPLDAARTAQRAIPTLQAPSA